MTARELTERWAAMSPAAWLAAAAGLRRYEIVIAWDTYPDRIVNLPCGVRWDAVRTPARLSPLVLERLLGGDDRHHIGPVLQDHRTGMAYWLTPTEADAGRWQDLPDVELLGRSHHIDAPAPEGGGTWPTEWIHWPQTPGTLTPPHILAAALKAAAGT